MRHVYILGISAFCHDAAAAIIKDGEIIAAAQEERFTRQKYDAGFPKNAINYCLREAKIGIEDLSLAALCDKSLKKIDLKKEINYKGKIIFAEHHYSHAASAFYPSPFNEAAIIITDGLGGSVVTSSGAGKGSAIKFNSIIKSPHSLGLLYSAFTYYCGFAANADEYKLMGLAPYGDPVYVNTILDNLVDVKDDGLFRLNLKYFDHSIGSAPVNNNFFRLFNGPKRKKVDRIDKKHMDLARSVQTVVEMVIMNMARSAHRKTKINNLCMAGETALNCVANGKILREGPFKKIWIQPAASDAGCALGAALIGWHEYMGKPRTADENKDSQKLSLLGPVFSDEEMEKYLKENDIKYKKLQRSALLKEISAFLADQKIIGWFQGRMEFGPRALGSRSILADPRSDKIRDIINKKVKFRESFRPFAPSVLAEKASEYFDITCESPYMLFVSDVKKHGFPAITHVDGSARIQTVRREDNPLFYDLISQFYNDYGCPMLVNTSFNRMGEPIVCTPDEAYKCFMGTNMDYLVIGPFICEKTTPPK